MASSSRNVPSILLSSGFERIQHHLVNVPLYRNSDSADGIRQTAMLLSLVLSADNLSSGVSVGSPAYHIGFGIGNDLGAFDSGADPNSVDPSMKRDVFLFIPDGGFKCYMAFNSILQLDTEACKLQLLRMLSYNCVPFHFAQDISGYVIQQDGKARVEGDKSSLAELLDLLIFFGKKKGSVKLSDGRTGVASFDVILGLGYDSTKRAWLVGSIRPERPYMPVVFYGVADNLKLTLCTHDDDIEIVGRAVVYYTSKQKLAGFAEHVWQAHGSTAITYGEIGCDVHSFGGRLLPVNNKQCTVFVIGGDDYLVGALLASVGVVIYSLSGDTVRRISSREVDFD